MLGVGARVWFWPAFQPRSSVWTAIRQPSSAHESDPMAVDEVIMGQVIQAGVGQAPARQASIAAGFADVCQRTTGQQGVRIGSGGDQSGGNSDPRR